MLAVPLDGVQESNQRTFFLAILLLGPDPKVGIGKEVGLSQPPADWISSISTSSGVTHAGHVGG
jgi:hypothetical protein